MIIINHEVDIMNELNNKETMSVVGGCNCLCFTYTLWSRGANTGITSLGSVPDIAYCEKACKAPEGGWRMYDCI